MMIFKGLIARMNNIMMKQKKNLSREMAIIEKKSNANPQTEKFKIQNEQYYQFYTILK